MQPDSLLFNDSYLKYGFEWEIWLSVPRLDDNLFPFAVSCAYLSVDVRVRMHAACGGDEVNSF